MSRSIRLAIVGLLSALLTLGLAEVTIVSATAAPAVVGRADSPSCTTARQQDAAAAADVSVQQAKYDKTNKKAKKAKKAYVKAKKTKRQVKITVAKKKLKRAKKNFKVARAALIAAQQRREPSSSAVVVYCGSNPTGTAPGAPLPSATPGVSPLAPLCEATKVGGVSPLQVLCDATSTLGTTTALQPLCQAVPQLAVLCTITPGQLADPTQVTNILNQIGAAAPQGLALTTFLSTLLTRLLTGDLQSVAQSLNTTPQVLAQILRALGVPTTGVLI